jgi:hypothetical protein
VLDEVRSLGRQLEPTYEAYVHPKFRAGQLVSRLLPAGHTVSAGQPASMSPRTSSAERTSPNDR